VLSLYPVSSPGQALALSPKRRGNVGTQVRAAKH
jgi:hypothetical protein